MRRQIIKVTNPRPALMGVLILSFELVTVCTKVEVPLLKKYLVHSNRSDQEANLDHSDGKCHSLIQKLLNMNRVEHINKPLPQVDQVIDDV